MCVLFNGKWQVFTLSEIWILTTDKKYDFQVSLTVNDSSQRLILNLYKSEIFKITKH